MDEQKLDKRINELMEDLYVNTYTYDFYYTGSMCTKTFQNYIVNDLRFKKYYDEYLKMTDNPVDIKKYFIYLYNKDSETLYNIINALFNLPDELKPEQICVETDYPWRFEFMSVFNKITYDEFYCDKNSEFMLTINKIFNDLTIDEIKRRFISWLENENDKIKDEIEKRRKLNLPKKNIYKYNSEGVLEKIYKNRNECCKEDNISKGTLSNHLAGRRASIKGFTYKEA